MPAGRSTPAHFKRIQQQARAGRGIGATPNPGVKQTEGRDPGAASPRPHIKTDWWERVKRQVIQRDFGICHACRAMGCRALGADSADHDPVPRSECEARGISIYDPANLKAIHGVKPCKFCGVKCNAVKFNGTMEAFRVKWEKKTGRKAAPPSAVVEPAQEGRDL